jgi:hypothetical protein
MLKNFGQKMKLQQGDIKAKVRGHLTATVWKDETKCKHTAKHGLPTTEGIFCDKHGRAVKLVTVHTRLLQTQEVCGQTQPHDQLLLY